MKVYHPQIEVTLIKTINRTGMSFDNDGNRQGAKVDERYKVQRIDLKPYLGEAGGVRTSKSVREPAGAFAITLADKMHPELMESLYALIEPMDLVEIRFCHDAADKLYKDKNGGRPPIVMRGLVSEIRRDESMGNDGKPVRKVVITGQDLGKLWQIFIIYYLQVAATGESTLTEFRFFDKYLQDKKMVTQFAKTFFKEIVAEVLNPFLARLQNTSGEPVISKGFVPYVTIEGSISPYTLNAFSDVSLYSMMSTLFDVGPYNEMFIEDNEDEVSLILRPLPFHDVSGKSIMGIVTPSPGHDTPALDIPGEDIQNITSMRSDKGVANWYWSANTKWVLTNDGVQMLQAQQALTEDKRLYPNSGMDRYGFRKMHIEYKLGAESEVPDSDTGTPEVIAKNKMTPIEWAKKRRNLLADLNKDNVVFESGTMRVRGNEKIKAGRFITSTRGGVNESWFYVVSVDHDFVPFQGYFTTINYERGTDFINRASNSVSPYLKELNVGGIR
jgi:hypothetical protein